MDIDFARKAVNTIGRCGMKIDRAAEVSVNTLYDLIDLDAPHIV